ncbi:hypothetical protein VB711_06630 [Cronbergia sp. UHCC 0137]|uniref:hypothetical protein n=1 Tax=Cronbergia sp. UHCC 0137 TaxID=3110239 RepID=UPI002B214CBC|nr:hypothetical protein [Cronbergia sp. UHCC 0137]MEA5617513.1 hypothetical protein [Cronbergia sp. UHCC 0137]
MSNTHFVEMACNDCEEIPPLNGGVVLTMPISMNQAVEKFLETGMCWGNGDFKHTYTAGCYGNENQIWDFSHYETYEPTNSNLPSMVILRYRPRNQEAAKLFYGSTAK